MLQRYCNTKNIRKKHALRAFLNFMPLRVAAHKRLSREASCESPAPEEGKFPLLWTLPLGRSANRGG